MIETAEVPEVRKTAWELLRFLEELMRAIARIDVGDPAVAQLTLLELRILMALGAAGESALSELSRSSATSLGQCEEASQRLRRRGLAERAAGEAGEERAFAITALGRRLISSLEKDRFAALESLISRLGRPERLRLEGATHLLGDDLDRLAAGMLAA